MWADRAGAVAVINASMFHDGGRSTGLLIDRGKAVVEKTNTKFGAFLATAPRGNTLAPVTMWGRGCPGATLATLKRGYETVVQNYRLLDCDGRPIHWKDDKIYSAAAVGVDRVGRILFIHLRAPYKMATFTKMLTDPVHDLDLVAAMYVEGGPEATLFTKVGDRRGLFVGSYETNFLENHDNKTPWPLPNVIMLVPKDS